MARKKGISRPQRDTIVTAAREIIKEGVGRRGMDFILRKRFGVSISRKTFTTIYREQKAISQKREARIPQVSKRSRKLLKTDADRYQELIRRGFIHEEAREFMKAQSLKYTEFVRMTITRQNMLRAFIRRTGLQPDNEKFKSEWRAYVYAWYKRNKLTTFNAKLRRVISPWDWFDMVSYKLPPEIRYSAKGRRKNVPSRTGNETASMRAFRMRSINQLKEELRRNPARRVELEEKIKKLGGKVK